MCLGNGPRGDGGSGYRHHPPPRPGTGRTPGWGAPGWPPSRRSAPATGTRQPARHPRLAWLADVATWPWRLEEHDPACRWRRLCEGALRVRPR